MSETRTNWLLLATMMLASFLTGIGNRIFSVSLPTISASLATDLVGISWAVIAFQIGTIGFSLVFGRIGDLYGRRNAPNPANATAFVGALNVTFAVAVFICLVALAFCSKQSSNR